MGPKHLPIIEFRKLGKTKSPSLYLQLLRQNVHRYLCKVQILPQTDRGNDSHLRIDRLHNLSRELLRAFLIHFFVRTQIDKDLIYGINMDILLRYITQINLIYSLAVLHIQRHSGRCRNIG